MILPCRSAVAERAKKIGSMDLGTAYCYAGVPLALYWSLTGGLLGWCISCASCLLSAQCLSTEALGRRSRPFRQAITPARGKGDNCYKP